MMVSKHIIINYFSCLLDTGYISIHRSAAYVIARRGMGYKERLPKRVYDDVHQSYEERWTGYLQKIR